MQPRATVHGQSSSSSERWTENAHFVAVADSARARQGAGPVGVRTKLTEYQLVRECLWMLRQPPNEVIVIIPFHTPFLDFLPAATSRQVSGLTIVLLVLVLLRLLHLLHNIDSMWFRLYTVSLQMEVQAP